VVVAYLRYYTSLLLRTKANNGTSVSIGISVYMKRVDPTTRYVQLGWIWAVRKALEGRWADVTGHADIVTAHKAVVGPTLVLTAHKAVVGPTLVLTAHKAVVGPTLIIAAHNTIADPTLVQQPIKLWLALH
jgi:hypothetical protein